MSEKTAKQEGEKIEKKKVDKVKMAEKEEPKGTYIYCGPTMKHVIKEGDTFTNGIPKAVSELVNENHLVKQLLVPIDRLIETKRKLKEEGSVENITYQTLRKEQIYE